MKNKFLSTILALSISIFSAPAIYSNVINGYAVSQNNTSKEVDYQLWDKFIKYDLCITDYESLTDEQKELCKFIFETEQSSEKIIRCERARRILAGDENLGERITLEQLDDAYGIWDKYSWNKYGFQSYIHCVADIEHLDGVNSCSEYWLDDEGTIRVNFYSNDNLFKVYKVEENETYELKAKSMPVCDYVYKDGVKTFISDGYIEQDGNYFFINPDNTAVLMRSQYKDNSESEALSDPLIIPSEVSGCPVTAIGNEAFMNSNVMEVVLPETIEFIDENAFGNCKYLNKINFPKNLKFIGMYAFYGSGLIELNIDCPNLYISPWSFNLLDITDAYINARIIGEESFKSCINLKNLNFGENVERINSKAFTGCSSIENLQLPVSIKSVGSGAFASDFLYDGVKSVTIPSGIEIIESLPEQRGDVGTSGLLSATHPLTDESICVFDSNCIINGWYDTEAHYYAISNNLKFNALDDISYGDINLDGNIGIADAVILQRYLLGSCDIGYEADINKDGIVNVFDMVYMRNNLSRSHKV